MSIEGSDEQFRILIDRLITLDRVQADLALWEKRAERIKRYIDQIADPNWHTLHHILRHLDGTYDDMHF